MLNIIKTGGKPPRILIYGVPKIGKSSFGAFAEKPIFIQTEDGLDAIGADAFPMAKTFKEVMDNLEALATIDHEFKTLVVDSLDHLEPLIWKQVAEENGKNGIEDIGYGKGYVMALDLWREYLSAIDYLRDEKGMMIVQIAHAQIKRFESPVTDSYDKYEIKLHKTAGALVAEKSDIILFANYWIGITKEANKSGQKDDDKKRRAVGTGERVLYTEERPAFVAGNRYDLPPEIPFDKDGNYWNVIVDHVPFFKQNRKDD